ncbi:HET-domain-containing protein [Dichomitus squalens]|uniref:HET-domain-containing protein n=1 Tax=Dichomitus squalens TaxID=114155 RepID=A0A4Q9PTV4_9APHY|nr:HET-domain-containing protein [Dichomitus squalens]
MRFVDTRTGEFVDRDPKATEYATKYAILSHTWDIEGEQSYKELRKIQKRYDLKAQCPLHGYKSPPSSSTASPEDPPPPCCIWSDPELSPKIREACRVAREAGYQYIWIDSCCIDQTSSSELTESINSMYQWYGHARECYAYLTDVPPGQDPHLPESNFRSSRWFKRGWTLQELIAPFAVTFLSGNWTAIGSKRLLGDLVSEITGIPDEALLHEKSLDEFSVAQRLSWAAGRTTTRVEDRAYSLLGIFDINMSTLYGEGERAFRRLQEEILRRVPDQSLFAWRAVYQGLDLHEQADIKGVGYHLSCNPLYTNSLFASSVDHFSTDSRHIAVVSHDILNQFQLSSLATTKYTPTPQGIRTRIPILPLSFYIPQSATIDFPYGIPSSRWYLAILGCEHQSSPASLLGRICYIPPSETGVELLCPGFVTVSPAPSRGGEYLDLFPLSSATIERYREHITLKTVYFSHPERASTQSDPALRQPHKTINILLRRKTRDAVRAQGYMAEFRTPDEGHPTTHWLTLSCDDHMITVEYRHTLENDGHNLTVEAHVKMSRHALGEAGEIEGDPSSVKWRYYLPWYPWFQTEEIAFTLAMKKLTVMLGLDWAAPSYYFLLVDIVTETLRVNSSTSLDLVQGAEVEGSGAVGEADEQEIGAEARASDGGLHQPDGVVLLPFQRSGGTPSPLEARKGEERGADAEPGEEVNGKR